MRIVPPESTPQPDWAELAARLRRFATALTGSSDAADELTQQTLAMLLSRRPERAGHLGYARRTLLRLWLDRRRSFVRRAAGWLRYVLHRPTETRDADAIEAGEQVGRVREVLGELPPRQRAVLVLRLVEELDYEQIAETLGCTVEAARANLHLARRQVRRRLGVER